MLLNHLEQIGVHCDPRTQLVVTCEVCRRPATKECWVCTMKICEFCSMVRHWKVRPGLHARQHCCDVCHAHLKSQPHACMSVAGCCICFPACPIRHSLCMSNKLALDITCDAAHDSTAVLLIKL